MRQARRCEQLAFRLQLKQKGKGPYSAGTSPPENGAPYDAGKFAPESSAAATKEAANDETKAQHEALNKRAVQLLIKQIRKEDNAAEEIKERFQTMQRKGRMDIMDIPLSK